MFATRGLPTLFVVEPEVKQSDDVIKVCDPAHLKTHSRTQWLVINNDSTGIIAIVGL